MEHTMMALHEVSYRSDLYQSNILNLDDSILLEI